MRSWISLVAAFVISAIACTDNPNIDDSKVKPTAANCSDVCNRMVALCGYAPEGNDGGTGDCTDSDGGGYCDTQMVGYLDCFSTAPSCQDAWNCFNTPDEGGTADDASGDDSGDASGE